MPFSATVTAMEKMLANILAVALFTALVYFLGREFAQNWSSIKSFSFDFNIPLLLLSSGLYAAGLGIFAVSWHLILRFLRQRISPADTILYFFITQPAKYIPGKVWIAVTRMKLCKNHDIPNHITFLSTVLEAIMEIFAGTYISAIAVLQTGTFGGLSVPIMAVITALGLLLLMPRFFCFFLNLYLKIIKEKYSYPHNQFSFGRLALLQSAYIFGTIFLGLAHALFLQSFAPVNPAHFPFLISITALSYIAGIVIPFAPGGLGVRESIWYIAMKNIASPHLSLIFSFASRLWTVMIEALILFISLPVFLLRRRRKTPAHL